MSARKRIERMAALSIAIALAVLALKSAAWWLTGSVALLSDALESIVNVAAAAIALVSIRIASRPADANHPFGHQKAEYLSAVLEGGLVLLAAGLVVVSAADALWRGHVIEQPAAGVAVNIAATLLNAAWAYALERAGREGRSPAMIADARHLWTDVVTSAGVVIGLLLVMATGWVALDALLALLVGLNILREGWRMVSASISGLMDAALDPQESARIEEAILANAIGAIEVHDIRTRAAGHVSFVELHLVVDGSMSVGEAHAICDRIEAEVAQIHPGARTTVHVEPDHKSKPDGLAVEAGT